MRAGEVTSFIAAPKKLLGTPSWSHGSRPNQFRLLWPIEIAGIGTGPTVEILHSAAAPHLKLSVMLNIPPVVARVDIDTTAAHTNRPPVPSGVPRTIAGHNHHLWSDNCPKGSSSAVPKKLQIARPHVGCPDTYPEVFEWFCAKLDITFSAALLPSLRDRETLL